MTKHAPARTPKPPDTLKGQDSPLLTCMKVSYATQREADALKGRSYECRMCGKWHKTSQPRPKRGHP